MIHSRTTWVLALLLGGAAVAQRHITIPDTVSARDGSGVGWVPGFGRIGCEQFLIGAPSLARAVGQEFTAITFRRDGFEPARGAGQADLSVWLSVSPLLDVRSPATSFAVNRGAATLVYQGRVALPDSPRLANRHAAGWAPPDAVTIQLTQRWRYPGGHLCLEVVGQPVPGAPARAWSVDLETDAISGARAILGAGCGPMATRATPQATVETRNLRPGAVARFTTAGDGGATAFFMLAAAPLSSPISLGMFGAPGCDVWVLPDLLVPNIIGSSLGGRPPVTSFDLSIPSLSPLLGATFATQWLMLGSSGLTTSNAVIATLAALPPQIEGSVVQAVFGAGEDRVLGLVQIGALPVIRLHW
jgi:hypothetical protein